MNRLLKQITSQDNCTLATSYLLSSLKVQHTKSFLSKALSEHPTYPGLLSIADVIGIHYDISSSPLKCRSEYILSEPEIKTPFLAHIKSIKGEHIFVVVTMFERNNVQLFNPSTQLIETLSLEDFDSIYEGNILLAAVNTGSKEKGYESNRKKELSKSITSKIALFLLPLLVLLNCTFHLLQGTITSVIFPVSYTLFSLLGAGLCTLLVWYEIDQHNPALKQICQISKHTNCASVLKSKGAKILGISWSILGFSYFTGTLLFLLILGITHSETLQLTGWLSTFSLPYVAFSIFYQWKRVKQWCPLCLLVQGVLTVQFLIAYFGNFHSFLALSDVSPFTYLAAISSFSFVFIASMLIVPALQKVKEGKRKATELQRLKLDSQIFESLLVKQKEISAPLNNMGISIGNKDATYKIIKVCNPYCGPCAQAHPVMEELAHSNEELNIQIIFTATEQENDYRRHAVQHLLAVDSKQDKMLTKKALDDWYKSQVKDYSPFAARYPIDESLELQRPKVKEMREWCDSVQIAYTPTFFICLNAKAEKPSFYQLPNIYSINDLNYFLAV